jgi:hypothetical protein
MLLIVIENIIIVIKTAVKEATIAPLVWSVPKKTSTSWGVFSIFQNNKPMKPTTTKPAIGIRKDATTNARDESRSDNESFRRSFFLYWPNSLLT